MTKLSFGTPEKLTPAAFKQPDKLNRITPHTKINLSKITFKQSHRGCSIELPMEQGEQLYGFGLQLKGFNHTSGKKTIRSNADPVANSGDSHAPVPFYVSTRGYGVYVDTARSAEFTSSVRRDGASSPPVMLIEIPIASGVDVYIFEGDTITDVVAQYNLFSGGGCMPALWGLGFFYRCHLKFTGEQVLDMARYFREVHIPCDILGLEPGWQSRSYPCSFVWDSEKHPAPYDMLDSLTRDNYKVNLWEHCFTHPDSPIYGDLADVCGDYGVWGGRVPDFACEKARGVFANHHKSTLCDKGITGFKLDECDGSDYTGGWSFPNGSTFPSGLDGEQMHALIGVLYQQTMVCALGDSRTLGEVRNSGALAAPYPFVLYSDLYDHKDFIRGVVNSGFGGILWSPEVRHAADKDELLARLRTVVFSAQALVNAWYIEKTPWVDMDCEDEVREIILLRMSLVPYLYSAFYKYHTQGIAPLRALVSDFTNDPLCYGIDDEYMFGDSLLAAPMLAGQNKREVYLPEGTAWFDFFTGEKYASGTHTITTDGIPVFMRDNSIIPIAEPVEYLTPETVFDLTLRVCGNSENITLIEDDGETYSGDMREIVVDASGNIAKNSRYRVMAVIKYS